MSLSSTISGGYHGHLCGQGYGIHPFSPSRGASILHNSNNGNNGNNGNNTNTNNGGTVTNLTHTNSIYNNMGSVSHGSNVTNNANNTGNTGNTGITGNYGKSSGVSPSKWDSGNAASPASAESNDRVALNHQPSSSAVDTRISLQGGVDGNGVGGKGLSIITTIANNINNNTGHLNNINNSNNNNNNSNNNNNNNSNNNNNNLSINTLAIITKKDSNSKKNAAHSIRNISTPSTRDRADNNGIYEKTEKTDKTDKMDKTEKMEKTDKMEVMGKAEKTENKIGKTEDFHLPKGRSKRSYSDIFFQMSPPPSTFGVGDGANNGISGDKNVFFPSKSASPRTEDIRTIKLEEINRQKNKASAKKSSTITKILNTNIDIFDTSTSIRKNKEFASGSSKKVEPTVLPYFLLKEIRKVKQAIYWFFSGLYEILVLGPHAGGAAKDGA